MMYSPLKEKSFRLAVRVVRLYQYLVEAKKEAVQSRQLLRCGTNPGAMIREANNAESGHDLIHQLSIAQKELGETQYWLELLYSTGYLTQQAFDSMISDTEDIMKILRSSIKSKRSKLNHK